MRLPHLATLLRPTVITDSYGDEVPGPLAPVGDPFAAWLQQTSSTEVVGAEARVVTRTVLYVRPVNGTALAADDVIEVDGRRLAIDGDVFTPVNPRGRARFVQATLKTVSHG